MTGENKAEVTLHDVLRAIVRGSAALLHDPEWIESALTAIDSHEEQAATPAPAPAPPPETPPVVPVTSGTDTTPGAQT